MQLKPPNKLNIMKTLQYRLDWETLEVIYTSFGRSILEYDNVVWEGCAQADETLMEDLQLTGQLTEAVSWQDQWEFYS